MFWKNKSGNWFDIPYFVIGAVGFAMLLVLMFIFNSMINVSFHATPMINESVTAMTTHDSFLAKIPSLFDWVLPLIYVAFIGFTVWSASLIQSSNKFLFIGFFISLFFMFLSLVIEDFWHQFATHSNIASYISSFPITNFMMEQMRYFTLFFCFIVMLMLYTRRE
jgi:hypothetical protein